MFPSGIVFLSLSLTGSFFLYVFFFLPCLLLFSAIGLLHNRSVSLRDFLHATILLLSFRYHPVISLSLVQQKTNRAVSCLSAQL